MRLLLLFVLFLTSHTAVGAAFGRLLLPLFQATLRPPLYLAESPGSAVGAAALGSPAGRDVIHP